MGWLLTGMLLWLLALTVIVWKLATRPAPPAPDLRTVIRARIAAKLETEGGPTPRGAVTRPVSGRDLLRHRLATRGRG